MRETKLKAARWMLLGAAIILAACTNPFADDAPTFDEILSAGWLDDDMPQPVKPIYCYETIGAPDCHAKPLTGEGGRLQGYEGPKPQMRVEK